MTEMSDHCVMCGLRPSALVHNATANGHAFTLHLPDHENGCA